MGDIESFERALDGYREDLSKLGWKLEVRYDAIYGGYLIKVCFNETEALTRFAPYGFSESNDTSPEKTIKAKLIETFGNVIS